MKCGTCKHYSVTENFPAPDFYSYGRCFDLHKVIVNQWGEVQTDIPEVNGRWACLDWVPIDDDEMLDL